MKITDLHVDEFGVWQDLTIDGLPEHMTVFFGRNEAGKTTLLQFIRTILYGFSLERRSRYLAPVKGKLAGGSLYVNGPRGNVEIQRHVTPDEDYDGLGEVALTAADGTQQSQHQLNMMLSGVDEPIFNNVFAVGLRELQELGSLDDTAAASLLYNLASGLDRVSLVDVIRDIRRSRGELFSGSGQPSKIAELVERRKRLLSQIDELAGHGARWAHVAQQAGALNDEIAALEDSLRHMQHEVRVAEVALQVQEAWRQREALDQQLSALGPLGRLADETLEQFESLNTRIEQRRQRLQQIKSQCAETRGAAEQLPVNRRLWSQRCRIEALIEHDPWIVSLDSQIQRLESEVGTLHGDLKSRCEHLGLDDDLASGQLPDVSGRTLAVLRKPARAVRQETEVLKAARQQREAVGDQIGQLRGQLAEQLGGRGKQNLNEALEEAGAHASRLRRRLQLEQRIDKMEKTREELREDIDELLDRQVLPGWKLLVCGVPFVLGIVLVLLGIFFPKILAVGWAVALLGLAGVIVAVVMKVLLERAAHNDLEECNEHLERLRDQLKQAKQEREEVDQDLPLGGGQLDSRLGQAEQELAALEELLPLQTQMDELLQRSKQTSVRISQASSSVKEARRRWRAALQGVGLPTDLTPKSVKELSKRCEHVTQLNGQFVVRREELEQRQAELEALTIRVEKAVHDVGLEARDEDPRVQLRHLSTVLAEQEEVMRRRESLVRQYRTLKRDHGRLARHIDKLEHERRSLLAASGVATQQELQDVVAKQATIRQLRSQRKQAHQQIETVVGDRCTQEELADQLGERSVTELERHWSEIEARLEQTQSNLAQLHQRRGQWLQEMKTLAEDRRLATARLELGCVEQQLAAAIEQWRVLAMISKILDSIREVYESQRQPETLNEASRYLSDLTRGQYVRIWTPLGDDVLRVDDAAGHSLPVEVLSCGTREAVFLSLRLALAAGYARRGATLPLVLDDVLVNFDADRAKAAAEVLKKFANAGHQLLLFTCHEHIMRIFASLKVEVRQLPHRFGQQDALETVEAEVFEAEVEQADQNGTHDEEARDEDSHDEEVDDDVAEDDVAEEDVAEDEEAFAEGQFEEQFVDEEEEWEEGTTAAEDAPSFTWESAETLWDEDSDEAA